MDVTARFLTLHLLIHTGQKALSPASDAPMRIKQDAEDEHSVLLLFLWLSMNLKEKKNQC